MSVGIVISRILYALPTWSGFLATELPAKINAVMRQTVCYGVTAVS